MKKIISLILCAVMLLSVTACSGRTVSSKDELANLDIGIILGSGISPELEYYYEEKNCEVFGYYTLADIQTAFKNGTIDCAVLDNNVANSFVETYSGYTASTEAVGEGKIEFVLSESKKAYQLMLDKAIDALTADGTIDGIVNGYFKDKNYKYTPKNLDNSNGEFKIALDTPITPYCENDGLNVTGGPALAILDAVCEYLGCSYKFVPTKTSDFASKLKNGTVDFALGDLHDEVLKDENAKQTILKTKPVIEFDYVIVSKK